MVATAEVKTCSLTYSWQPMQSTTVALQSAHGGRPCGRQTVSRAELPMSPEVRRLSQRHQSVGAIFRTVVTITGIVLLAQAVNYILAPPPCSDSAECYVIDIFRLFVGPCLGAMLLLVGAVGFIAIFRTWNADSYLRVSGAVSFKKKGLWSLDRWGPDLRLWIDDEEVTDVAGLRSGFFVTQSPLLGMDWVSIDYTRDGLLLAIRDKSGQVLDDGERQQSDSLLWLLFQPGRGWTIAALAAMLLVLARVPGGALFFSLAMILSVVARFRGDRLALRLILVFGTVMSFATAVAAMLKYG